MDAPISVSFVVPCLNEEANIGATVREIQAAIGNSHPYEVILIDDCSTDHTLQRMNELAQANEQLRVFHNLQNLGLGGSYKRGVGEAQMNHIMLIPGDNGFPTASIKTVLSTIGQADIVIPYVLNPVVRSMSRMLISKLFTSVLNSLFRLDVRYYNGAVLHRTALLRTITITTDSFAYQAEAIVKLVVQGASYVHCPVMIRDRVAGRSSALKLKNILAVAGTILHLVHDVGLFRKKLGVLRKT